MTPARFLRRGAFVLRWFLLTLAVVVASLFLTWRALAAADFAYPWLYGLLGIDQTIAESAPRNEVRPGFERTDTAERVRLFGAIVDGVRADGEGLGEIVYRTPRGETIGRLLTAAELRHLNDVAELITRFERLGWLALVLVLLLGTAAALRREHPPAPVTLLAGLGATIAVVGIAVLSLGPVEVFYWLHEQMFPPEHQWFFWYEESLMSMLMQAPNLFGAIAVLWFGAALVLAGSCLWGLMAWLRRRARDH